MKKERKELIFCYCLVWDVELIYEGIDMHTGRESHVDSDDEG